MGLHLHCKLNLQWVFEFANEFALNYNQILRNFSITLVNKNTEIDEGTAFEFPASFWLFWLDLMHKGAQNFIQFFLLKHWKRLICAFNFAHFCANHNPIEFNDELYFSWALTFYFASILLLIISQNVFLIEWRVALLQTPHPTPLPPMCWCIIECYSIIH